MIRQRITSQQVEEFESVLECDTSKVRRTYATKITVIRQRALITLKQLIKKLCYIIGFAFLFVTIIAPLAFRHSTFIRRNMIFMNWLNVPLYRNLSTPEESFGLNCTKNFYITTQDGMTLGMWHVLPKSRLGDCDVNNLERIDERIEFADNRPVIYYVHGNGGARGGPHRKELYKMLAYTDNLDYHVVAVDYRGYGDSTNVSPSVDGVVSDAAAGYFWLLDKLKGDSRRVTVWGHSLGTAISTYVVSRLQNVHQPSGLLLESPFNTIGDAVRDHPFSVAFRWLPYFESMFVDPVVASEVTNFDTQSKIEHVSCPLLILHAVDDHIVPYQLGVRLYRHALEARTKQHSAGDTHLPLPKFITFDAKYNYGHKNIYLDKEMPNIMAGFVTYKGDVVKPIKN